MTYNARESSAYLGAPEELYHFSCGNNNWYYTSADEVITYGGQTYQPYPLSRTSIGETQEVNRQTIKITAPTSCPVAQLFMLYPSTSITALTIFRKHRDDDQFIANWMGRILNAEYIGSQVELHGEPATTAVRRLGLRKYYQRQCPHVLYGTECGVSKISKRVMAQVASINGLSVNLTQTLTQGEFNGGMMGWQTSAGKQWRLITSSYVNSVMINFPPMADDDEFGRGLPVGTMVELYPGCQHTMTDCINKFNNIVNYGGYPYIPFTNPFGMTTLF